MGGTTLSFAAYVNKKIKTKGHRWPAYLPVWHMPVLERRVWGHGARALDVLTAWVTVLASASWRQAGSLALVTWCRLEWAFTSLVTCMGEDVVPEDGGWVVFATIQVSPGCIALCTGAWHLWEFVVTQWPLLLPAHSSDPDSLQASPLSLDSGLSQTVGRREIRLVDLHFRWEALGETMEWSHSAPGAFAS